MWFSKLSFWKWSNRCHGDVSIGRLDGKLSPTLSLDWTIIHSHRQGEVVMAQIIEALYAKNTSMQTPRCPGWVVAIHIPFDILCSFSYCGA